MTTLVQKPVKLSCANCDDCSVRGRYCYFWQMPTKLDGECKLHSKLRKNKSL